MKKTPSERLKDLFLEHAPMIASIEASLERGIEALTKQLLDDKPVIDSSPTRVVLDDLQRMREERDHYRAIAQTVQKTDGDLPTDKSYIKGFQDGFREGAKFALEDKK